MGMSGLYSIKPWFVRSLSGIEDGLVSRRVRADALSYAAVAVSALAGACIVAGHLVHPWFWLLLGPLCFVRLGLNALDGSVARRSGMDRPFGKVVNEVTDRVSDVLLLAPLVAFMSPLLVLSALGVVSLVSLAGSLGEVVGTVRLTQGPMGKADRCAVLSLAGVVAGLTGVRVAFAVALAAILVGGVVTVISRLRSLHAVAEETAHVR